ncbi:MAG: ribosomal L7Ae/L30e/S12e/Gadd45 family protein [Clostridia bacterium]|nr:ribosomal L7Ae/L30e/S12e/Gadd45 family protein [Clostridia bacterium]
MINRKILGMLGLASRARKITFGADSTEQDILKNKVKLVVVAEDASDRTKNKFIEISKRENIPIIIFGNIEELSKTIGKQNKAIIGVKENNIAQEIEKLYRGDVNG